MTDCVLQAGDITGGADFARAKRFKKLTARLSSAQAKSKMAKLRSQTMYVLLFLMVIHIGAFAATRILIAEQKTHIEAVWRLSPHQKQLHNLVHFQRVHCMTCRIAGLSHMCESSLPPGQGGQHLADNMWVSTLC